MRSAASTHLCLMIDSFSGTSASYLLIYFQSALANKQKPVAGIAAAVSVIAERFYEKPLESLDCTQPLAVSSCFVSCMSFNKIGTGYCCVVQLLLCLSWLVANSV